MCYGKESRTYSPLQPTCECIASDVGLCRFKNGIYHRYAKLGHRYRSLWLGHIKAANGYSSIQKGHKKMDGNKYIFIKSGMVSEMPAASQDVSRSDSCDVYEWSDGLHSLDAVNQLSKPKNRTNMIWVTPRVAGEQLKMEVDTGSDFLLVSLSVHKRKCSKMCSRGDVWS